MNDDVTMKDKMEVLRNEERVRKGTYKSLAEAEFQNELGGRFSAAVSKTTVIGSSQISYPQLPEGNPFKRDPVPTERPLGFDINAQECTGEPFEIEKSLRQVEDQRRSWVIGELLIQHPEMGREEAERIYHQANGEGSLSSSAAAGDVAVDGPTTTSRNQSSGAINKRRGWRRI